jgi:hypothetical protein
MRIDTPCSILPEGATLMDDFPFIIGLGDTVVLKDYAGAPVKKFINLERNVKYRLYLTEDNDYVLYAPNENGVTTFMGVLGV